LIFPLVRAALAEDAARRDSTSAAVINPAQHARAVIRAKAPGIIAGAQVACWVFEALEPSLRCTIRRRDGQTVAPGQTILTVAGSARSILAAERTALNFLGHLSGIATLTRQFVKRVYSYPVKIMDTRKTLPGLRRLEKYAVRIGGGHNHRMGLHDAVLIKTNHLKAMGHGACPPRLANHQGGRGQTIQEALQATKQQRPRKLVEVEVMNLREFRAALKAKPDSIMLDNWSLADIRKAVRLRNTMAHGPWPMSPLLEASGGVTLSNVRALAKTGVDRISIGRLTHSAPALDVALEVL